MSCTGMPSATTTIVRMPVSMASMMASAANGGGTNMPATSAPVRITASCTVSNRGMPRCFGPPLPGVTPATTLVPILMDSSAWKLPCWPVRPWMTTREDLLTKMLMGDSSAGGAHGHGRGGVECVGSDEIQTGLGQDSAPLFHVGAGEAHDHRHGDLEFTHGAHDAFCYPVTAVDAGEDIDQHRLDVLVQQHDAKRVGDFLWRSAASHIEKVRWPPAVKSDGVHRGHGE